MKYEEDRPLNAREIRNLFRVGIALICFVWGASYLAYNFHFWLVIIAGVLMFFVEKKKSKDD